MIITKFAIRRNGKTLFSKQKVKHETHLELMNWIGQKMNDAGLYAKDFLVVKAEEVMDYKDSEVIGAIRSTKFRTSDGSVWKTIIRWKYEEEDLKYVLSKEES
jgi:hypothetical protein